MSRQFAKILGTGSKPAVYKGAPGNPDIVAPVEVRGRVSDPNGGGKDNKITQADVNIARGMREDRAARDTSLAEKGNASESAQSRREAETADKQNLGTTTMRQYADGSVHDLEDMGTTTMRPTPRGNVTDLSERPGKFGNPGRRGAGARPARKANPKYLAADVQRANEDLAAGTAADRRTSGITRSEEQMGEDEWNKSQKSSGGSLRSINGITYDMSEWRGGGGFRKDDTRPQRPSTHDLNEDIWVPSVVGEDSVEKAREKGRTVGKTYPTVGKAGDTGYRAGQSAGDIAAEKADRDLMTGARIAEQKEKEAKKTRGKKGVAGAPKFEKPSTVIGHEDITEPETNVVEDTISDKQHDLRAEMTEGQEPDITSTTMREVPTGNEKVIGSTPVRSSGELRKPNKPKVNVPGNVIPQVAIDTFGGQATDRRQAERENKRIRENRSTPTTTTIFDPNKISARPTRGQTPERAAVLGAIREGRATELAKEGKTMTTVSPDVMATAKRLGRTSHYKLDEDYMNSTGFLAHEAVQKAVVAHGLGVQHTLADPKYDHLHAYLGGNPLEAKSRLAEAYKIVDRNRRGNPEKVPGEFALLRSMVHAGSSPQQTLRAVRSGGRTDVTINGQNPVLAEGSSENRRVIHESANDIAEKQVRAARLAKESPAVVHLTKNEKGEDVVGQVRSESSVGAGVTVDKGPTEKLPDSRTDRVARRKVGQKPEEAEVKEFTPAERRNAEKYTPKKDDSKGPRVVDVQTAGLRPGEQDTNRTLPEESDDIIYRLKNGIRRTESSGE